MDTSEWTNVGKVDGFKITQAPPDDLLRQLNGDIEASGGEFQPDPRMEGAIGATMFDVLGSEDGSITVLLPQGNLQCAPSQSLVRISSRDDRKYLGVVTRGPFAEPDSLRGDAQMLVNVAARGGIYLPPHHGRIQVSILGEEASDGNLRPPLLRPLPNSAVHVLDDEEAGRVLGAIGDIRLGLASNYRQVEVRVPSDRKDVFPRHTAVMGTTGGGKSTTIARLAQQAQAAGMAVILLDVEGEYTFLHVSTRANRGCPHAGGPSSAGVRACRDSLRAHGALPLGGPRNLEPGPSSEPPLLAALRPALSVCSLRNPGIVGTAEHSLSSGIRYRQGGHARPQDFSACPYPGG